MSYLQLLATGKSLIGMKNNHSPYRMRAENLLPKFESTKNPFAAPAKTEPVKFEPVVAPAAVKVATMETYPLFDTELKPAVVLKETQTQRGSVRVVSVTQSRLPHAQAKPGRIEAASLELKAQPKKNISDETAVQMQPGMMEANASGVKTAEAPKRAAAPAAPAAGLVDGSPLGLKTGNPTKNALPAPVVAGPKAKPVPARPQNNCAAVGADAGGEMPLHAAVEDARAARSVAPATKSKPSGGWLQKLNPLSYLPVRKAARRTTRTPMQAELSLERRDPLAQVKVMRNDLNDTDLEVVPVRRTEKPAADTPRLQPIAPAAATGLSRFTSRIFGMSQTQAR